MGRIREGPLRPHVRPLLCGLLGLLPSLGHANMVTMSGQAGQKKQVAVDIQIAGGAAREDGPLAQAPLHLLQQVVSPRPPPAPLRTFRIKLRYSFG